MKRAQARSRPQLRRKAPPVRTIVLTVVLLLSIAPRALGDTAMFRGDAQHSGVYERALSNFERVKWKFHTGGPVSSSPAVADGMVYVGSADGNLYALDRSTGALRWKFATKSRVVSSPAVANGMVFFGSYDGTFYAVDGRSGALKWKFSTGGERRFEGTHLHGSQPIAETMPDVFDVYLSSPTIWHGSVYFGSGDGNVYALDGSSGAMKWSFKTGNVVHASPAIADGTLFVGSWDSYFYALDASTGKEKWRFKTGDDPKIHNQVGIQSSAAVSNGIVYFGCRDSHLYALDAKTGRKRWSFGTGASWVISSPAVRGATVYFATSDSGLVYEITAAAGAVISRIDFHGWPMFSSPAIAGDMLYIGSWSGKLFAIDLRSRRLAWAFQTDAARANGSALTLANGSPNYAAAYRSDFYDDLVVGYVRMMTLGAILSSPVVDDHVVYFGSQDGNVYAIS